MSSDRPISEEDERLIRERIASASKSQLPHYPAEQLAQLLDHARDLRDLLDWERKAHADTKLSFEQAWDMYQDSLRQEFGLMAEAEERQRRFRQATTHLENQVRILKNKRRRDDQTIEELRGGLVRAMTMIELPDDHVFNSAQEFLAWLDSIPPLDE